MNTILNIKGLDRVEVFRKLYNAAFPYGLGWLNYIPGDMDYQEAEEVFKDNLTFDDIFRVDYCRGRAMKVIIKDDEVDVTFYNQYHGAGLGESVVNEMLEDMKIKDQGVQNEIKRS